MVADSTAWATQVRLLARTHRQRGSNAELGHGTRAPVKVRGPTGPPGATGGLRVTEAAARGDTYG